MTDSDKQPTIPSSTLVMTWWKMLFLHSPPTICLNVHVRTSISEAGTVRGCLSFNAWSASSPVSVSNVGTILKHHGHPELAAASRMRWRHGASGSSRRFMMVPRTFPVWTLKTTRLSSLCWTGRWWFGRCLMLVGGSCAPATLVLQANHMHQAGTTLGRSVIQLCTAVAPHQGPAS